ncbi:cell division protein FtsW, lipid II flippase [Actinopolymorpha cephalotaxi]|uniref:Cell division protein FtsW (Lipid II flippase) n=1 Tax=Actinopolymorpha cephalotaxi TaxID=504797 RepID=A0A1I2UC51_9ACTN|nr:FtsW/RodA/SpoVE family cell cycle protein [Actinopolymorpha cephalotaxi]NYH86529.1 cell division protein FtsW (lipid II flippase) [Actinopolymorpha cephalotaxi]SFG74722.1 cell division protein FtsW, lipid II flippase [Actinopolymorpha cephalotaxi]
MSDTQQANSVQPRKRRGAELVLLVLALGVAVGAYAVVGVAVTGHISSQIVSYALGLVLLVGIAHLVVRFRAPYADPILLPCVVLLNGLGLALIHRLDLSKVKAAQDAGEAMPRVDAPAQLTWTAVGVAAFIAMLLLVRDHRWLQRATYTALFAGVALLLLPLVPGIGVRFQGAQIWVRFAGLSFQPGEVAKMLLIVFFAGYLVVKKEALALAGRRFLGLDLPRGRDLGPILAAWFISLAILVFQRDLGTAVLFFGVFVIMLYVATERPGWLFLGGTMFVGGAWFAYIAATQLHISQFSHIANRVNAWLHPFDPANANGAYQIIQSLYGFAYGGLLGRGLGEGHPTLVPLAKSDFIAAVIGEELGLTGLMAILLLYGVIVERGLRTALVCRDQYGKLLAIGVASVFAIQVFVVIGGVTKLIPLTGLTTPFLSYGGSSLVANWALVALMLRISDFARRPAAVLPPAPTEDALTQVVVVRR